MEGVEQPRLAAMTADSDRSQSASGRNDYRIDIDEVQKTSMSRVEVSTADRTPRGDGEGIARSPNSGRI